jgi:hypothetical protein
MGTKKNIISDPEVKVNVSLLSVEIRRLLASYDDLNNKRKESIESNYKVSQVLGSVAFLYERVRNMLDYKGDHLLRKNAIERILRRQIWEKKTDNLQKTAENLIKELIWARYIKNDSVPKEKISELFSILQKYMKLFSLLEMKFKEKRREEVQDWFIGVLSSEVEEILDPSVFLKESLNYEVFSWFRGRFLWEGHNLDEKDRDIQMFIAVHRSLTKSDKAWIRHRLLKAFIPGWENLKGDQIEGRFENIINVQEKIEDQLRSPYQGRMFRFVQRQLPAFLVLKDYMDEDYKSLEKTILKPDKLGEDIERVCKKKYSEIGLRIRRGLMRSIIYIFFTKATLALMIEIPYELLTAKSINYLTLVINILFPPILMFLMGSTIRKPSDENTKRIIKIIKSFVYTDDDAEKVPFSLERKKIGSIISRVFLAFYLFLFFLIFGSISLILISIGFNVLSASIFFIFLSLVLLFLYRVRYTATELNVQGEREGFLSHIFSLVTIPFINVGSLLSQGFQRLNVLLLIMDFLIEAPLKNVITIFEEWNVFIREKREEVIEIPN